MAPKQDRAIVAEPSLDSVPDVVAANTTALERSTLKLAGRHLAALRQEAREAAVQAAIVYMTEAGEPLPPQRESSILVSGHQPELFHPGVWVKNFALQGLARKTNTTSLNIIVDNDIVKATSLSYLPINFPLPDVNQFPTKLPSLPFDTPSVHPPNEDYLVQNESLFATYRNLFQFDWGYQPFLHAFWDTVLAARTRTRNLGERLVTARRHWERQWGCHNLEVPVSRLCQTEPFAWFAGHLLCHLEDFHAIYNQSVRQYRHQHRLRSRNHPVPELGRQGDLWEAPFWAWNAGTQQRGRLFVRLQEKALAMVVNGTEWCWVARSPDAIADVWDALISQGKKVRSRALTTTLFARLFLADLFIHGLGGGKYDEVTDNLIRQFYGLEPPRYLVLSTTLLLPFPRYPGTRNESEKLHHRLRELQHNPQRYFDELDSIPEDALRLAQTKERLIQTQGTNRLERRRRFHDLRKITDQLSAYLHVQKEMTEAELQNCRKQIQANDLLSKRDFSFVFHPEETLREFLTQFL